MKHYFRYLPLLVLAFWSAQTFALDEIDRFAQKCDLFKSGDYNIKSMYRRQVNELTKAKIPIKMSFEHCDFIRYVVQLKNGSTTVIENGFPTNKDPDNKESSYSWNPISPSKNYWLFNEGGWEWAGWVLVDKTTGRKITSKTECANHEMRGNGDFLAVICSGAYENTIPTVYVVNLKKTKEIWSQPIELQKCNEHAKFVYQKFEFINQSTLHLEGNCRLSMVRGNEIVKSKKWVKVKTLIQISEDGLKVKSEGVAEKIDWDIKNNVFVMFIA